MGRASKAPFVLDECLLPPATTRASRLPFLWMRITRLFGNRGAMRRKQRKILFWKRGADEPFNSAYIAHLVRRCKRNGASLAAGASGSSDAMNVVLGIVRKIEINHEFDAGNIDTARRDVSSHENAIFSRFKSVESFTSLRKRPI